MKSVYNAPDGTTISNTALLALLGTRQFLAADIYVFTLANGQGTLRYCAGDLDIVAGGNTYTAGGSTGPYFDRTDNKAKLHQKAGTDVDTLIFDCLPGSSTVNAIPFLTAARYGTFDNADFELWRAFMSTYGNISAGVVPVFVGRVAEIDFGRSMATFTINSHLELFNQNMPRNLYQSGCANVLYDASCTLLPANFQATGTVGAGSTASAINTTLVTTLTLPLGIITMTSGVLNGVSRTIKDYTSGSLIDLIAPFPTAPATGDTFKVNSGCDLKQSTCALTFSNVQNFRGTPNVPIPETAL